MCWPPLGTFADFPSGMFFGNVLRKCPSGMFLGNVVLRRFYGGDMARNPRLRHARTPGETPDTNGIFNVLWGHCTPLCARSAPEKR